METVILSDKRTELEHLLDTFFKTYPPSEDGQRHIKMYKTGREVGQKNYHEILGAEKQGNDVSDAVLQHMLPYVDSSPNRERGAWIHVASAINKDIKSWFQGAEWTSPDDWPKISKAILAFTRRCVEYPAIKAIARSFVSEGKDFSRPAEQNCLSLRPPCDGPTPPASDRFENRIKFWGFCPVGPSFGNLTQVNDVNRAVESRVSNARYSRDHSREKPPVFFADCDAWF